MIVTVGSETSVFTGFSTTSFGVGFVSVFDCSDFVPGSGAGAGISGASGNAGDSGLYEGTGASVV